MAHCDSLRNQRCRWSSKKSGPCSFFPIGKSSGAIWMALKLIPSTSNPDGDLVSSFTFPVIVTDDSRRIFCNSSHCSGAKLPAENTTWILPDPSLNCKKKIFPLDLKLYAHPLISTSCPKYPPISPIRADTIKDNEIQ